MATAKKLTKVCVIEGFSEGDHHSKKFLRALHADHFTVVKRPEHADIILTHSGGAYLLPADCSNKIVMLSAPPCGFTPRPRAWLRLANKKIKHDLNFHISNQQLRRFFVKNLWNFWYIFSRMPHNVRMARKVRSFAILLPQVNARKVIVVCNRIDDWTSNMPPENIANNPTYIFLGMSGTHDDLWIHPERYADVLKCIYES